MSNIRSKLKQSAIECLESAYDSNSKNTAIIELRQAEMFLEMFLNRLDQTEQGKLFVLYSNLTRFVGEISQLLTCKNSRLLKYKPLIKDVIDKLNDE